MTAADKVLVQFIPLFNAKGDIIDHAVVDAEDFELLDEFKWHRSAAGYALTLIILTTKRDWSVVGRMHRIIMNAPDGLEVDHRNHDRLDNRKVNLRIATNGQNKQNSHAKEGKRFKGVGWMKEARRTRCYATISKDGKKKFLGYFKDEISAAIAYNKAALELFGEFACLNQIPVQEKGQADFLGQLGL
jgi:hypothetical protein